MQEDSKDRDFVLAVRGRPRTDLSASIDFTAKLQGEARDGAIASFAAGADVAAGLSLIAAFPLDLFHEAGLIARLQAQLEAAAFVNADLGLEAHTFENRLRQNLKGPWLDLAEIFLEELVIEAGFWAKASFAAEAVAEAALVGSLIPVQDSTGKSVLPGFTFSLQYSAGISFGTGAHFVTNFGFSNSQRLLDRLTAKVTLLVDEMVARQLESTPDAATARAYFSLLFPLASRTIFELGVTLAKSAVEKQKPAAMSGIVGSFVRQAQQLALDSLIDLALNQLAHVLGAEDVLAKVRTLESDRDQVLQALYLVRDAVSGLSGQEETTDADWLQRVSLILDPLMGLLRLNLLGDNSRSLQEGAALMWSAAVLVTEVRDWADEPGAVEPFGDSPTSLPQTSLVATYIATRIEPRTDPSAPLTLAEVVQFILSQDRMAALGNTFPALRDVLGWVSSIVSANDASALLKALLHDLLPLEPAQTAQIWGDLFKAAEPKIEQVMQTLFAQIETTDPGWAEIIGCVVKPISVSLVRIVPGGVAALGDDTAARVLSEKVSIVLLQILARMVLSSANVLVEKALADAGSSMRGLANFVAHPELDLRGNQIFNQVSYACRNSPVSFELLRDDVVAILNLAAGAVDRLNGRDRTDLFALLQKLATLGLTSGDADLDSAWNARLSECRATFGHDAGALGRARA